MIDFTYDFTNIESHDLPKFEDNPYMLPDDESSKEIYVDNMIHEYLKRLHDLGHLDDKDN